MILTHVAAMSKNRVIGALGKLPWNIPEDMKFFKETTKKHIMIMGRKTFESMPKVLPDRFHIVISRNPTKIDHPDVLFVPNIESALQEATKRIPKWPEEVFIIGGGEIYRQTMTYVDKIYLTVVDQEVDGDAFYPTLDERQFILIEERPNLGDIPFSIKTYLKKMK